MPSSYLAWAVEETDMHRRYPFAYLAVMKILHARYLCVCPAAESPPDISDAVKAVYRRVALLHHPDRGGTKEGFQAVHDFYDQLTAALHKQ